MPINASGAAPAPQSRIIDGQVAARHPQRRHHERADRAADPERGQHEGEAAGAAAGLVAHRERQQHLDRADQHQHVQAGERERGEQPAGAEQVAEALAQLAEHRATARGRTGERAHGQQGQQGEPVQAPGHQDRQAAGRTADHAPGQRRAGGLLRDRAQHALHPVGREQLVGRQQGGQQRGVGREEERLGRADQEPDHRQLPQLQLPGDREQPDHQRGAHPHRLDDDQQRPPGQPVGGHPADQHAEQQARGWTRWPPGPARSGRRPARSPARPARRSTSRWRTATRPSRRPGTGSRGAGTGAGRGGAADRSSLEASAHPRRFQPGFAAPDRAR